MICLILKPFVKVLRACPSSILKDLVFTISKTNFIIYNTPLYTIPYIKTSIFLTLHLNIISLLIFYSFSLYLSLSFVSLFLNPARWDQHIPPPPHPTTHTTTTTSTHHRHHQPDPPQPQTTIEKRKKKPPHPPTIVATSHQPNPQQPQTIAKKKEKRKKPSHPNTLNQPKPTNQHSTQTSRPSTTTSPSHTLSARSTAAPPSTHHILSLNHNCLPWAKPKSWTHLHPLTSSSSWNHHNTSDSETEHKTIRAVSISKRRRPHLRFEEDFRNMEVDL